MKKPVPVSVCALLLAGALLFAAAPANAEGSFYLYVSTGNAGKLHLRARPSTESRSLGLYPNGTAVWVEDVSGGWALVQAGGRRGFMMLKYLTANGPDPWLTDDPNAFCMYVRTGNSGGLHLRERASRDAPSLGLYPNGTRVNLIANYGNWSSVRVGGKTGYMMSVYLTSARPGTAAPTPTPAPFSAATVRQPKGSFVYLRATRDSSGKDNVLCKVPSGSAVTVVEWGERWSRVVYNGMEGYMVSRYLK